MAKLTPSQEAYFAMLARIDPSPKMARIIANAREDMESPAPVARAVRRGLWRGLLSGMGFHRG